MSSEVKLGLINPKFTSELISRIQSSILRQPTIAVLAA